MYLWFKLLHVFFVISWFAGLFYLPRIYVGNGWLAVKLLCGLLLLAYQLYCGLLLRRFQNGSNMYSHRWYRVFNELPVLMMVAALYMVVFKPF